MSKKGRKKKNSPELVAREILEALDERGQVIALLPRGMIHQQRLRHRSVHVFLFDPKGRLYLQKRARSKDENPGLWDSSAAGHVEPAEPLLIAAKRELQEELGLMCNLIEVLEWEASPETNWEFVTLFVGITNRRPRPNAFEIEEGRFFALNELQQLLLSRPEDFTPVFRLLWHLYQKKGAPKPNDF